jgi:hypothetical protein
MKVIVAIQFFMLKYCHKSEALLICCAACTRVLTVITPPLISGLSGAPKLPVSLRATSCPSIQHVKAVKKFQKKEFAYEGFLTSS